MNPPSAETVEQALARDDPEAARAALQALLQHHAEAGDALAALTLRVMAQSRFSPDAMAAAIDRLLALVREQDAQIRTLRALLETEL